MIKQMVIQTIGIAIISVSVAFGVNALRPNGLSWLAAPQNTASRTEGPASEISLGEAVHRFQQGDPLFVDARPPSAYQIGHIQGAKNLPNHGFEDHIHTFLEEVPPKRPLIAYCDGEHCDLGRQLAEKLAELGYQQVFYLQNGLSRWKAQGQPVAGGSG